MRKMKKTSKTRMKTKTRKRTSSGATHRPAVSIRSKTASPAARISIRNAKVVAPTVSERNMAFKTLHMIYQNTEFSGDENKVFRGFLERYHENGMKKEALYDFLRSNPAIRRKLWESDVFE